MRLNIGCGEVVVPGWLCADKTPAAGAERAVMGEPLPWEDKTFDAIVANHSLVYVAYRDLVPTLGELRRILQPGGVLRILAPDILRAFGAYDEVDVHWFPDVVGDEKSIDGRFAAYLTWYSTVASIFTAEWLVELGQRAGFSDAGVAWPGYSHFGIDGICELDSRPDESIVVELQR